MLSSTHQFPFKFQMTQAEVDDESGRAVVDRFYVDVEHLRKVKSVQLWNWNTHFGQC